MQSALLAFASKEVSSACGMYRLVTVPDSFLGFCANCKATGPDGWQHHPGTKAPPYRYCSGTTSSKETQESKTMKNRKAKILLARRNGVGVWRWLRISNRRVRLTGCCGVMGHSCCKKPSAAQNRWKNHLRTKGA